MEKWMHRGRAGHLKEEYVSFQNSPHSWYTARAMNPQFI